ncbi:MAG: hypothetical protein RR399_02480, partial [Lachnospiraceae bacterium]
MNESEKRRKELLNNAREQYSDRRTPPAIHPRHRAIYGALYEDDDDVLHTSSLSLRIIMCVLLFLCFVGMDYQHASFKHIDTQLICDEITYQINVV